MKHGAMLVFMSLVILTGFGRGTSRGQVGPGGHTVGGGTFVVTCGGFNDTVFSSTFALKLCFTLMNSNSCEMTIALHDATGTTLSSALVRENNTVTICGQNVRTATTQSGARSANTVMTIFWRADEP